MTHDTTKEHNELVEAFDDLVERSGGGIKPALSPVHVFPKPNDTDYLRGWITRHFVRKVNDKDAYIVEIDKTQVDVLVDNPYYKVVSLRWRISGPERTTYREDGTVVDVVGVVDANRKVLEMKEEELEGISLRLPNLKQFWKGS